MRNCSSAGKGAKTGKCGNYTSCPVCQYRYFYMAHMKEEFGADLILTTEEQAWIDNVYSKLDPDDIRYIQGKFNPETPTAHRPKAKNSI